MRHDAPRCTRCPPAGDGGGGDLTEDLQGTGGEGRGGEQQRVGFAWKRRVV